MTKKVWLIECTNENHRDWYICCYQFRETSQFYETRNEASEALEEVKWKGQGLLNTNGSKTRFRVNRFELLPCYGKGA